MHEKAHYDAFWISLQCVGNFTAVYWKTDLNALRLIRKKKEILSGKDCNPFRKGFEFSSRRTGVFFGPD